MRARAFDPPAIPAEVWARPEMTAALRKRDFVAFWPLINPWISQTRLSASTGIPQGRVSDYKQGKYNIQKMAIWEQIADAVTMPDAARACLGLVPRLPAPQHQAQRSPIDDAEQHTEFVHRIANARAIDSSVIRTLDMETDAIRRLDRQLGAPAVTAKLQAHIDHVDACLRYSLLPGQRQSLAAVLADASSLAGWQAIDMGRLPAAWEHYERSIAAAREADDKSQLAYATGERAYVLTDLAHHQDALTMVRAAHDEARTAIPHQIKAWLYAAEGEMAAAADEEGACRRALDQAAKEIDHGPSDEDLPYLALNDVHLARWRGNCLVTFGDPETADELAKALEEMDSTFTRAEAGLRCDLAAALHVRGEHEEAQRHLSQARELAHLTGSARQRRRIRELARRLGPAA